MKNEYLTYQKFNDVLLAREIAQLLTEKGIVNALESSKYFDPSFANNSFSTNINLKIRADDFDKADIALDEFYKKNLAGVDHDYYLFGFSDEELEEIISKPDEWGHFDYQLAQKILKEKGKGIDPDEIKLIKFRRINDLSEPESTKEIWLVIGYMISIVGGFFGILGGFIGVFIGWAFAYLKKTLPDGHRVYYYNDGVRKHGKLILVFSSIVTLTWLVIRYKTLYM